jgi:hypothetical protein
MENEILKDAKFKLLCVYSHKPNGVGFTQTEKNHHENKQYHYSDDCIQTKIGAVIIRHDVAFANLIAHVDKHWDFIDNCSLFMTDDNTKKEIKIGFWCKVDFSKNYLYEIVVAKYGANVICSGVKLPEINKIF